MSSSNHLSLPSSSPLSLALGLQTCNHQDWLFMSAGHGNPRPQFCTTSSPSEPFPWALICLSLIRSCSWILLHWFFFILEGVIKMCVLTNKGKTWRQKQEIDQQTWLVLLTKMSAIESQKQHHHPCHPQHCLVLQPDIFRGKGGSVLLSRQQK